MGIADRDWYRRQGEDPRPVIALSVRRYAWVRWAAPVAIVAVLLAGVAYQGLRVTPPVPVPSKPAEPGKLQPAPPPAADAVAFPKDGFTLVNRRPGTDWDSPLTLSRKLIVPPHLRRGAFQPSDKLIELLRRSS